MIKLYPVPPWMLHAVPPGAWQHVQDALERGESLLDVQTVAKCIADSEMNLWLVLDDTGSHIGTMVTEVRDWPKGRVCTLVAGAGDAGYQQEQMECVRVIEDWARTENCAFVDIYGRKGWRKRLPREYGNGAVIYRRRLEDGRL